MILLGGRYSSGTTAAADGLEDLSPAPLEVFAGLAARSVAGPGATRLSFFCSSAASAAFFLSRMLF